MVRRPGAGVDIGWLPERSVDAVRHAVAQAAPALADRPIELRRALKNGHPVWSRGTAWVGDDFVVKGTDAAGRHGGHPRPAGRLRRPAPHAAGAAVVRVGRRDAGGLRSAAAVLLHGDLHGHNVLCEQGRVTRMLDYDGVSVGDHHDDFRYLPGIRARGLELFAAAVGRYEALSGRAVSPAPVPAWHIRTVRGDALWRSDAGVELPDGGMVDERVIALRQRVRDLTAWRAFPDPEDERRVRSVAKREAHGVQAPVPVGGELAPVELLGVVLDQPEDHEGGGGEEPDGPGPERPAEHAGDERRQHEHEQHAGDPAAVPERLHTRQTTARS